MNTASKEWAERVAARNAIETATDLTLKQKTESTEEAHPMNDMGMSSALAAWHLAEIAAEPGRTEIDVTALEMGARRLSNRWFQRQRRRARRLAPDEKASATSASPRLCVKQKTEVPANPEAEAAQ